VDDIRAAKLPTLEEVKPQVAEALTQKLASLSGRTGQESKSAVMLKGGALRAPFCLALISCTGRV
jgi:hypothetical protein